MDKNTESTFTIICDMCGGHGALVNTIYYDAGEHWSGNRWREVSGEVKLICPCGNTRVLISGGDLS